MPQSPYRAFPSPVGFPPSPPLADLRSSLQAALSGYTLGRQLDRGGMATDYLTHDLMIREFGNNRPENVVYVEHWLTELRARLRAGR